MFRTSITLAIIWLMTVTILHSQNRFTFPADSLLNDPAIPVIRKAMILPIAAWQRLSYRTKLLDCQFQPSCSNYGSQAIGKNGLFPGLFMTSDRIVRCNPAALDYHAAQGGQFYTTDFRIKDSLRPQEIHPSGKSPALAALLSLIVPGSGRIYAGRTWDGIFGFMMFAMPAASTAGAYRDGHQIRFPIYATAAAIIYGGEIYGAWRSAKYYQVSH